MNIHAQNCYFWIDVNASFAGLVWFVCACFAAWLYAYARLRCGRQHYLEWATAIAAGITLLIFSWRTGVGPDEGEHLHCAWMLAQGMVPYRDFWQHHFPVIWYLLLPVARWVDDPAVALGVLRVAALSCMAVSVWCGWMIARKVWGAHARLGWYLASTLSAAMLCEAYALRPDSLMNILVLAAFLLLISPKVTLWRSLAAGAMVGFAVSCGLKPVLFVPFFAIASYYGVFPRSWRMPAVYCAGVLVGVAPLLCYLQAYGLFSELWYWAIVFNGIHQEVAGMLPVIWAVAGAGALYYTYIKKKWMLFTALVVSSASFVFMRVCLFYYTSVWCVLSASAVCAIPFLQPAFSKKFPRRAAAIAAIAVMLLAWSTFIPRVLSANDFARDTRLIRTLYRVGGPHERWYLFVGHHPIFGRDATGLFTRWQEVFACWDKRVRARMFPANFAENLRKDPPAAIALSQNGKTVFSDYCDMWMMTPQVRDELNAWLAQRYRLRTIEGVSMYLRDDIEEKMQ